MSGFSLCTFVPFFRCLSLAASFFVFTGSAWAQCTSPTAAAGAREWFSGDKTYKLCDGTNWIPFKTVSMDTIGVSSGLIGYWRMDETSGTLVSDSSGSGNHGTWDGIADVESVAGRIGSAFDFDGANDDVWVPHSASLNFSSGYTYAAWVKFDSSLAGFQHPDLISKNDTGGWGSRWVIGRHSGGVGIIDGKIRIMVAHDQVERYPSTVFWPVDQWTHVAVSWNGTNIKFYADGQLVDTQTLTTAPTVNAGDLSIGYAHYNWGGYLFDGPMDDVRLYNRALSDAEILTIVNISDVSCAVSAQMDFDTAISAYKFCDGNIWRKVECTACPTLGACTAARAIDYFAGVKALGWCDGSHWRVMAQ